MNSTLSSALSVEFNSGSGGGGGDDGTNAGDWAWLLSKLGVLFNICSACNAAAVLLRPPKHKTLVTSVWRLHWISELSVWVASAKPTLKKKNWTNSSLWCDWRSWDPNVEISRRVAWCALGWLGLTWVITVWVFPNTAGDWGLLFSYILAQLEMESGRKLRVPCVLRLGSRDEKIKSTNLRTNYLNSYTVAEDAYSVNFKSG